MSEVHKRFLVLMDDQYYPSPGTSSIVASFDTEAEAVAMAKAKTYPCNFPLEADYSEVFDCDKRQIVWEAA